MTDTSQDKALQVIEQETSDILASANSMIISSQEHYDSCAEFLKGVKGLKQKIDETFDKNIKDAHQLHKNLVATKKSHYEPLDQAEAIVKGKTLDWIKEEKRKQEEAQRKIDEAAKKEEERKRKEKEEQEREWRRKQEEAQKEAERLEAEGNAEEARKAQEKADKAAEKAEERAEEAEQVHVPSAIVQPTFDQAKGQSVKKTWYAEVTDIKALCKAIVDDVLPETMVKPDMTNLNALARTMKDSKTYPGVKFCSKEELSVRR